jgi:hypothetical protein
LRKFLTALELPKKIIEETHRLRKFLTALELPKKIIEETHRLRDHCISMLPNDLPQPFTIKF